MTKKEIYDKINLLRTEIAQLVEQAGGFEFVFVLSTKRGFLWRLWFLISAPLIWLIKGEVKIK